MTDGLHAVPVAFARALRAVGVAVPVGSTIAFADSLTAVGVEDETTVYWAGRATLVQHAEDVERYDAAFAAFWHGATATTTRNAAPAPEAPPMVVTVDEAGHLDAESGDDAGEGPRDEAWTLRWSDAEVLREKDLAECTPEELEETARLLARMRVVASHRRSRRLRRLVKGATTRPGARLDLRATVRTALRSSGEIVELARRAPSERPRRLVLLVDVSGSMDPYARALLRFAHAAVAGRRNVEAFALGTRLTRVSRGLATRDPDAALRAATAEVPDWSGGTRLGPALRAFNDRWGVAGMARGAIVVILSDGWDRGDPSELGAEMARLRRVAHRVVWVNPLKATPGFAPTAGGMAAALPYVDELVEGHSVASLERLAEVIGA